MGSIYHPIIINKYVIIYSMCVCESIYNVTGNYTSCRKNYIIEIYEDRKPEENELN